MTTSRSLRNHSATSSISTHGACNVDSRAICETSPTRSNNPNKESQAGRAAAKPPRLRSACDGCHAAKTRCTGGDPCARCVRENIRCHYSYMSKLGKPKGSLNKKTIERLQQFMTLEPLDRGRGHLQQRCSRLPQQREKAPTQAVSSSEDRNADISAANVETASLIGDRTASTNSADGNIITVAPVETQIAIDPAINNPPSSHPAPSSVSPTTSGRHASQPKNSATQATAALDSQVPARGLIQSVDNPAETTDGLLSAMLSPSNSQPSTGHEHLVAEDWLPSITDYLDMMNESDTSTREPQSNFEYRQHGQTNGQFDSHAEACFWTDLIQDKDHTMEEPLRRASSCTDQLAQDGFQTGPDVGVATEIEPCLTTPNSDLRPTRSGRVGESVGSIGRRERPYGHGDSGQSFQSPAPSLGVNTPFPSVTRRSLESEASSSATSMGCNCFSSLSNCLCQLQDAVASGRGRGTTRSRQAVQPIDVLLMRIQRSIPIVRALLSCEGCMHDSHCLLLTNMVLARLLGWVQASVARVSKGTEGEGHEEMGAHGLRQQHQPDCQYRLLPAHVQLGTYTATKELGYKVTRVLLQMHCAEVKRAASEFYRRVQQIDYDQPDRSYLLSKARHLQTELKWLTEEVSRAEDGMP